MKNIIIAFIFAASLLISAYILNRNFYDSTLLMRIAKAETKMELLQDRFEESNKNAQDLIDEIKCIVQEGYAPYDFIIPVSGGFLGIREE